MSKTADNLRKFIAIGLGAIILILALDAVGNFLSSKYNPFAPGASFYLDPNPRFDSIPEPKIESLAIADDSNPTFAVEGALPKGPDSVLVYSLNQPRVTFDTVDKAVKTAAALGFSGNYTEPESQVLQWENSQQTRKLTFNRLTKQWRLRTQYFFDAVAQAPKQLADNEEFYTSRASSILSSLGFGDQSLRQGEPLATFSKLGTDGFFTKPLSPQSADYVTLDIFRKLTVAAVKEKNQWTDAQKQVENPPENITAKVYTLDPRTGPLHTIVSDEVEETTRDIYALDFTDFDYNYDYGVYLPVTPEQAWERIRQGKGSLVLSQLQTDDYFAPSRTLSVSRFVADASATELAYFEPAAWDGFVYPIYVFRGRIETSDNKVGRFVFFVDALQRVEN